MGICHLCKKEKKLIKSHIIPEGFYKKLYNEKRQTFYASEKNNQFNVLQKGNRELLLCKECDGKIIGDNYDKYGIEVIRDDLHVEKYIDQDKEIWTNIDYDKFKIFILSVLWRASISEKFHRNTNLREKTKETIRLAILSGNAPGELELPVRMMSLVNSIDDDKDCDEFISSFNVYDRYLKKNGFLCDARHIGSGKAHIVLFGGYMWEVIEPNVDEDDPDVYYYLKDIGVIVVLYNEIRNNIFFRKFQNCINYASENIDRFAKSKK